MKTITIYDLLGLVKDNNAPKKILIRGTEYSINSKNSIENYYVDVDDNKWLYIQDIGINDEIEIIDEPKEIEKIKSNGNEFYSEYVGAWIKKEEKDAYCEYLMNKLNELIDVVNELKKENK